MTRPSLEPWHGILRHTFPWGCVSWILKQLWNDVWMWIDSGMKTCSKPHGSVGDTLAHWRNSHSQRAEDHRELPRGARATWEAEGLNANDCEVEGFPMLVGKPESEPQCWAWTWNIFVSFKLLCLALHWLSFVLLVFFTNLNFDST